MRRNEQEWVSVFPKDVLGKARILSEKTQYVVSTAEEYRELIDALKPFAEILDQADLRSLPKDTKFSPKMTLEPFLNARDILAKVNGDKA